MNVCERSSAIIGAILLVSAAACASQPSAMISGRQPQLSQRQAPLSSAIQSSSGAQQLAACASEFVPVLLNGNPETLHGDLCDPNRAETIFVTVPGASYNRLYWDFPYQPEIYSQVRSLNAAGYAVFNVDRIGTGLSSKPLSTLITGTGQANVYYQAITKLRSGTIGSHPYAHIILLSHSLGAGIATLEASEFGGVDGVILTGDTHYPNPEHEQTFEEIAVQQANLQPRFADYDSGYLTTPIGSPPGSIRQEVFYGRGDFDPIVVSVDELTKDVYSGTEVIDAAEAITNPAYTLKIDVPVLLAVGGQDFLACATPPQNQGTRCESAAAFLAQESGNYAPAAQLETCVLPLSGHSMDLALNTGLYQLAVIEWTQRHFPTHLVAGVWGSQSAGPICAT
jgi:pimeloyl-ACP methyl ester carboxylesterase